METITYSHFKTVLVSYCEEQADRAKQLTYALYLLGNVELEERSLALGFIQGFLAIAPFNF